MAWNVHAHMADQPKPLIPGLFLNGVQVEVYEDPSMTGSVRGRSVVGIKSLDLDDMEDFYDSVWRALVSDNVVEGHRYSRGPEGYEVYHMGDVHRFFIENVTEAPIMMPVAWYNESCRMPSYTITPTLIRVPGLMWVELGRFLPGGGRESVTQFDSDNPDLFYYDGFIAIPPGVWDLNISIGGAAWGSSMAITRWRFWSPQHSTNNPRYFKAISFEPGDLDDYVLELRGGTVDIVDGQLHIRPSTVPVPPFGGFLRCEVTIPFGASPSPARYTRLEFWYRTFFRPPSTDIGISVFGAATAGANILGHIWKTDHTGGYGIGGLFGQMEYLGWTRFVVDYDSLTGAITGSAYDINGVPLTGPVTWWCPPDACSVADQIRIVAHGGEHILGGITYLAYGECPRDWYFSPPGDEDPHKVRRRRAAWMNMERPAIL